MSPYNNFERKISNALRMFPRIKKFIKLFYVWFNYLIKYRQQFIVTKHKILKVNTNSDLSSFFGYYDLKIENSDGMLVYCVTEDDTRKSPEKFCKAWIVVADRSWNILYKKETRAFNWQQGARQHWLNDDCIIFNDFQNGIYVAIIHNVKLGTTKVCPVPVQCAVEDRYLYSIDYIRISRIRPDYGYFAHEKNVLESDAEVAILEFDIKKEYLRSLISFETLSKLVGQSTQGVIAKVNHLMVSPDNNKIVYLYRQFKGSVRYDYLMVYDRVSQNTEYIETGEIISHYCWISSTKLFAYMSDHSGHLGFYFVDISNGKMEFIEQLKGYGDGHPFFHNNRVYFDSYPDKARMQHLFEFDLESGSVVNLASLKQPLSYKGQSRCDLHPRLNAEGDIFFDSSHSGRRSLYKLELD